MSIFIKRTKLDEAEELWEIQKRVFKDDLEKYKDEMNPANETLERLREKINKFTYFTIFINDKIFCTSDNNALLLDI